MCYLLFEVNRFFCWMRWWLFNPTTAGRDRKKYTEKEREREIETRETETERQRDRETQRERERERDRDRERKENSRKEKDTDKNARLCLAKKFVLSSFFSLIQLLKVFMKQHIHSILHLLFYERTYPFYVPFIISKSTSTVSMKSTNDLSKYNQAHLNKFNTCNAIICSTWDLSDLHFTS